MLFLYQEGVFGVMANVLVSYVILFIFFGAFLNKAGASRFFIDLSLALAGTGRFQRSGSTGRDNRSRFSAQHRAGDEDH